MDSVTLTLLLILGAVTGECMTLRPGFAKSACQASDGCGFSVGDENRIVGGEPIDITEAPYQVSLRFQSRHICGGSILTDKFVLTARHCMCPLLSAYRIHYGSAHLGDEGQKTGIERALYHYGNPEAQFDYDLAVLEVTSPIAFGPTAKPVALPKGQAPVGTPVFVTGWGCTEPRTNQLMAVTVNIVDFDECNAAYNHTLTPRMLCAAAPEKDACQGDSGGPAVVDGVVYGIVSMGNGCARPRYPGVYTNVGDPTILEFIRSIIGVPS